VKRLLAGALSILVFLACTAPDYKFAAPVADAGPIVQDNDSGPIEDSGAQPVDADATDVDAGELPFDAATMAFTGDSASDCTSFTIPLTGGVNSAVVSDGVKSSCMMFFHNDPWHRSWASAKTMCTKITRNMTPGRLATVTSATKAKSISGNFNSGISTWIGLSLDPAGAVVDKSTWHWVTGEDTSAYDGWTQGHPVVVDDHCAQLAGVQIGSGTVTWTEADCTKQTGVLCEIDLPL
jgi:hypothetical protein